MKINFESDYLNILPFIEIFFADFISLFHLYLINIIFWVSLKMFYFWFNYSSITITIHDFLKPNIYFSDLLKVHLEIFFFFDLSWFKHFFLFQTFHRLYSNIQMNILLCFSVKIAFLFNLANCCLKDLYQSCFGGK